MEQIEILSLAQEALLRRYDAARNMVAKKPSEITKAYRDQIVDQIMDLRRMMLAEHKRKLEEAEAATEKQTKVDHMINEACMDFMAKSVIKMQPKEIQKVQQPEKPQQPRPEVHRYETVIEYNYGHITRTDYPNKEVATRAYNVLKDLMGTIPVINRISLTENGVTIRSYERGDF